MLRPTMRSRKKTPVPLHRSSAASSPWAFVREFLRSPREVGTLIPCSAAVAKAMVKDIEMSNWAAAAELGPGNGALTPTFVETLPPSCRFFAVELSPALAAEFHQKLPGVDVAQNNAAKLEELCRERGIAALDGVFSALPLGLLGAGALADVLHAIAGVLRPGGLFAQVTYWPTALMPGKQMREQCARAIGAIESDRLVAGNAPPAWVFRCIRR